METPEALTIARDASVWPRRACAILVAGFLTSVALAQTPFTWQQIKDKFETTNPTLKANQLNIDESRAAEITAFLRPNPSMTGTFDQIKIGDQVNVLGDKSADGTSIIAEKVVSGSFPQLAATIVTVDAVISVVSRAPSSRNSRLWSRSCK